MHEITGTLKKMQVTANDANQVTYALPVGEQQIDMNALIGTTISLSHTGKIYCVHCGSKTKKSFNQGYCYRCLITLAQCDSCIIKPELCHYHEGTCREPEWGEKHCFNEHFVYLANTGTIKVGITRHATSGISSRWMDQGATQATVFLRVKDRLSSGLVETLCKQHIADKTNWRKMLKGSPETCDLQAEKKRLMTLIGDDLESIKQQQGLQAIAELESPVLNIHYPVEHYPEKIKSINLDKTPAFSGTLNGIKGQYLMLDEDRVINMRKYAGYEVSVKTDLS